MTRPVATSYTWPETLTFGESRGEVSRRSTSALTVMCGSVTAAATGLAEAALEASAVADPHTTVKADVERLLASPQLSPKVSVSGHVYDIATGHLTTTVDARYP